MAAIQLNITGTSTRRGKNPKTTAQTLQRVLVKAVAEKVKLLFNTETMNF